METIHGPGYAHEWTQRVYPGSQRLIDSYRSMIVRFASPATSGFLSPLLSLYCLVSSRRNKTSGTRVQRVKYFIKLERNSEKNQVRKTPKLKLGEHDTLNTKVQGGIGERNTGEH